MHPKTPSDIDLTVGIRMTALRKAKGLSQTALGRAVGVTFQQIQKYEKGQNRVGAGRLQEIAKFLEVPVSVLFSDDTEIAQEDVNLTLFRQPGAVDLMKAYAAIENAQLRRDILAIARTAARLHGGSSMEHALKAERSSEESLQGDGSQALHGGSLAAF